MKQQLEIKPLLDSLINDKNGWKAFKVEQELKRQENAIKIKSFIEAGLENNWLNRSVDIDDGDFVCEDFLEFGNFLIIDDLHRLKVELEYSNWAINQAFVYNDFAFINQINGGKEWAVFKYNKETGKSFQFESWTGFAVNFQEFKCMTKATNEQLKRLEW